jgi:hypothetical protein
MSPLLLECIGAIVRWLLTMTGAALIAKGVITPDQAQRFTDGFAPHVVGAVLLAAPLVWSLWHKWWGQLKLTAARSLPAHADDGMLLDKMRELQR